MASCMKIPRQPTGPNQQHNNHDKSVILLSHIRTHIGVISALCTEKDTCLGGIVVLSLTRAFSRTVLTQIQGGQFFIPDLARHTACHRELIKLERLIVNRFFFAAMTLFRVSLG